MFFRRRRKRRDGNSDIFLSSSPSTMVSGLDGHSHSHTPVGEVAETSSSTSSGSSRTTLKRDLNPFGIDRIFAKSNGT